MGTRVGEAIVDEDIFRKIQAILERATYGTATYRLQRTTENYFLNENGDEDGARAWLYPEAPLDSESLRVRCWGRLGYHFGRRKRAQF